MSIWFLESVNLTTGEKVFQDIGLPSVNVLYYNGKGLNINSYDDLVNYVNNELSWENAVDFVKQTALINQEEGETVGRM
jgi:hypothetical protein